MSTLLEKWDITEERLARAWAWLDGLRLGTEFAIREVRLERDGARMEITNAVIGCRQFSESVLGATAGCSTVSYAGEICRTCRHLSASAVAGRILNRLFRMEDQLLCRMNEINARTATVSGRDRLGPTDIHVGNCLHYVEMEMERPGLIR